MKKVFISYAHENIDSTKQLYYQLKSFSNIEPWYDKECLLPGDKWRSAITKAIKASDFFIVLISKNSTTKRGFVQRELIEAFEVLKEFPESHIYLIPIRIEECEMQFEELNAIQYVDFFPDWNEGFEKLLKVLEPELKSDIPEWLSGKWKGNWSWKGNPRNAEMMVYYDKMKESSMTIEYRKSGILSIVEQNLEITIDNYNSINIKGTGYRFVEKGLARGWFLDAFKLKTNNEKTIIDGVKIDKRGVESKVSFCRNNTLK
jgi:hypothetical protein